MMLVTRPDYDPATRYLSAWSSILMEEAERRKLRVIDLPGEKARKADLVGRINKLKPDLLVLNGHGSDECIAGQDAEVLVKAKDNAVLLKGKVTYAVSCNSAAVLGEEVGTYSDTAYIGFENEFAIIQSQDHASRPLDDPFAKPFMEFSNQVVTGLLKGHKTAECVSRAKETGKAKINALLTSDSDPDKQAIARYLWWDIQGLVCKGDQNKKIL
ncbi:hypothetical protein HYV73_00280 [Candidatus Uhrbacteria bacterium]|nr:hypothetical protein [Candidatus Uhrbacteria bacterium]